MAKERGNELNPVDKTYKTGQDNVEVSPLLDLGRMKRRAEGFLRARLLVFRKLSGIDTKPDERRESRGS